jgi:putative FmdB family regulatory protein
MATYEYRCDHDGAFDEIMALGTAPVSVACPACGGQARRVFSPPMLRSLNPALVAAVDHAEKTRHEPDVVTSLPPSHKRTPMAPLTPTLARLPRP